MARSRRNMRVGTLRIVLERDGPYCRYCGRMADDVGWRRTRNLLLRVFVPGLQLDHVVPYAHGGSDDPDNLVMSCEPCNRRRGDGPQPPLLSRKPFKLGPPEHTLIRDDFADIVMDRD